jgi:hypothetical protein
MSERVYLKFCDKLHDEVGFHAAHCPVCSTRAEESSGVPSFFGGILLMMAVASFALFVLLGFPLRYTFDGVPHEITLGRP